MKSHRVVDPLLFVSLCALLGAVVQVAPWPTVISLLLCLIIFVITRQKLSAKTLVFGITLFAVGAIRAGTQLDNETLRESQAKTIALHPQRCAFRAVVVSSPMLRGVLQADVMAHELECEGRIYPGSIRVRLLDLPDSVVRGDSLEVVAQLALARRTRDFDLGDGKARYARRAVGLSGGALAVRVLEPGHDIASLLDHVRTHLRRALTQYVSARGQTDGTSSVARALVLGEEDLLPDDDAAYRRSGLVHLLAVSGSHVALVVLGLVTGIRWLLSRSSWLVRRIIVDRIAAGIGIPICLAYVEIAGASGSARRATYMAFAMLFVRAFGRRHLLSRVVGTSIFAAWLLDPLAAFDLSFMLSLAATFGLTVLARPLEVRFAALALPSLLAKPLAATLGATAACTPLVLLLGGDIPVLGVVANMVAVPVGELAALPLANLTAITGALGLDVLAHWLGLLTAGALSMLTSVAVFAATPSWSTCWLPPPTSFELALLVGFIMYLLLRRNNNARQPLQARDLAFAAALLVSLVCLELNQQKGRKPRGLLRITSLDVGQGDATLVDLPNGQLMLIDGGGEVGSPWNPGSAVILPALSHRRRRTVDVMVLSHPHPDHFLGLGPIANTLSVGEFWDTGQGEREGALPGYGLLLGSLRSRKVPIRHPTEVCGTKQFGGAIVEVLHPCPSAHVPMPDFTANDGSFVLRIRYGNHAALLVGDAEHGAESYLLATRKNIRSDFLKIGHHGSRTSSSREFIDAVQPKVAVISTGGRNRYGHPHASTMRTLMSQKIRVFRTDQVGSVSWTTDGSQVEVQTTIDP